MLVGGSIWGFCDRGSGDVRCVQCLYRGRCRRGCCEFNVLIYVMFFDLLVGVICNILVFAFPGGVSTGVVWESRVSTTSSFSNGVVSRRHSLAGVCICRLEIFRESMCKKGISEMRYGIWN